MPVPLRWAIVHVLCVFVCGCLYRDVSRGARRPAGARGLAARPGAAAAGGDAPRAAADGAQSARRGRRLAHVDHVGRVPVRGLARRAHTHRFTFPLPLSRVACSSQLASSMCAIHRVLTCSPFTVHRSPAVVARSNSFSVAAQFTSRVEL